MPTENSTTLSRLCECGCGQPIPEVQKPGPARRFVDNHSHRNFRIRLSQRSSEKAEIILCACGCGEKLTNLDKKGRPRRYIVGHFKTANVGRKMPEHVKELLRKANEKRLPWNKGLVGAMPPPPNKGKKGLWSPNEEQRRRLSESQRGERGSNWKGGVYRREKRTVTFEWQQLRKKIYERDQWICAVCQKPCANRIICHHIRPVRYGGSDDPFNLTTVCGSCHQVQERKFGTTDYFWGFF
jgi:hypothetical protein